MKALVLALLLILGLDIPSQAQAPENVWLGTWKMTAAKGDTFLATLTADGKVTSTLGGGDNGVWESRAGRIFITFESGLKVVLMSALHPVKAELAPGKEFTDRPDHISPIEKLK